MSKNPWEDRNLEEAAPDDVEAQETETSEDDVESNEVSEVEEDVVVTELKEKLEVSQQEVLRAHAEMENVRRRMTQEATNSRKFAVEKVVIDLLPVLDSLEQALQNAPEGDPMTQGVELTIKMITETLTKYGVKMLDPVNEKFNPQFHEAMSMQPNQEVEPETVLTVFQKGYMLHERLVRPARVVVSSKV